MPVLVNYNRCNCMPTCFAARACPKETLRVDSSLMKVVVDATVCGSCPAPCLNFCDAVALKYAPDLAELDIMHQELYGTLTADEIAEARQKLADKRKAEEARAREADALAATAPLKLTTKNFYQEVAQSELPVIVDFWAEWCGPCKQFEPTFNELAREFSGVIKFAKLNVDEEPQIAGQLNVQSIPTMMIFYGGQVADMIVGAVGKEQLQSRLQRVADALARAKAAQAQAAPAAPAPGSAPAPARPNGSAPQPGATPRPTLLRSNGLPFPPRRPKR